MNDDCDINYDPTSKYNDFTFFKKLFSSKFLNLLLLKYLNIH